MGKHALIVANFEYRDEFFRKLVAPPQDAKKLETVLTDPAIGGFEVEPLLLNKPYYEVRYRIQKFLANRAREDLLLLYFSGHGVKDENGQLYFATVDTEHTELQATSVEAAFVTSRLSDCLSRKQVLLLDCCYSGAFAKGMIMRAGTEVNPRDHFAVEGRGLVVLTATDSTSYAFESDEAKGEAQPSLFTRSLVEGLRTGEADLNSDGVVDTDELYEYVLKHVTALTSHQHPRKSVFNSEGTILVANNPQPLRPAELPPDLQVALENPFPAVRLGAVGTLDQLLRGKNKGLALTAQAALSTLKDHDDSMKIRQEAAKCLEAYAVMQRPAIIEVKAFPTPKVEEPQVPPGLEGSQPNPPPLDKEANLGSSPSIAPVVQERLDGAFAVDDAAIVSAASKKRSVLQWRRQWIAMVGLGLVLLAAFAIHGLDLTVKLPVASPRSFSFTTIDAPDAHRTWPQGLTDAGEILGHFSLTDSGSTWQAFLRTPTGAFTTIDVRSAIETWAYGINGAGQIVGDFNVAEGKYHGFLRTPTGAVTIIDPPGATAVSARGINGSEQIVGYFMDADGKFHAFLRTPTGAFTTIDVPGAIETWANGINGAGQIVGIFNEADRKFHGFLRTPTGAFTTIDPPGATYTEASSINGSGQIVGFFIDAGGKNHGFLRTPTGAFTTIDVPGAIQTRAHGINGAGQIVGDFTDAGGKDHGFFRTLNAAISTQ